MRSSPCAKRNRLTPRSGTPSDITPQAAPSARRRVTSWPETTCEKETSPAFEKQAHRLLKETQKGKWAAKTRYLLARVYEDDRNFKKSARYYKKVIAKHPRSPLAPKALFQLAWLRFQSQDYRGARKAFSRMKAKYPDHWLVSSALYWAAASAERTGERKSALALYRDCARGHRHRYYGQLALRAIGRLARAGDSGAPAPPPPGKAGYRKWMRPPPKSAPVREAAALLSSMGFHELAAKEYRRLGASSFSRYHAARAFTAAGQSHRAIYLINESFWDAVRAGGSDLPKEFWEIVYPLAIKHKEPGGADPYLVNAVIRAESAFDIRAFSPAGAMGLMQLMPSTGRRLARKHKIRIKSVRDLFDPKINTRLGARHLGALIREFDGALVPAIASYNAGRRTRQKMVGSRTKQTDRNLHRGNSLPGNEKLREKGSGLLPRIQENLRGGEPLETGGNAPLMNDSRSLMAIGLMSGTSADGVDAALVRILPGARAQVETLGFHAAPYPRDLRERLLRAGGEAGALTDEICSLHREVGEAFASAAFEVVSRSGARLEEIDFIGSHGQTVRHLPEGAEGARGPLLPSTLQIGDPAFIAQRTGITCVSDFRARDVAAGGAGAPLTPWAHRILFGRESAASAFLNLGGISNITYLPPLGAEGVFGFDCGPANMTLDALARRITNGEKNHDAGGGLAAAGRVCPETLAELRRHPYLERKPPKSTGRETFGEAFVDEPIEGIVSRRRRSQRRHRHAHRLFRFVRCGCDPGFPPNRPPARRGGGRRRRRPQQDPHAPPARSPG